MKKLNGILKFGVSILFIAIIASCSKNADPYADYTLEREATQIKAWKTLAKLEKAHLDSTSSGLYYIIDTTKIGTGPTVKSGNTVTIKYIGMYIGGTIFDTSGDGTITYVHKTDRKIAGWEEGVELLNKGAKATFLIPSALAYGTTGYYSIPPNTPVIFVIEMVDIK